MNTDNTKPFYLCSSVFICGWYFFSCCRFAMDFDLLGVHAFERGFRQAAGDVGPAPEYRGGGTQHTGDGADGAGVPILAGDSGEGHGHHHDTPRHTFDGGKDAAAVGVGHVAQQLRHVEHARDADGGARDGDEDQRPGEVPHLAEDDVRRTVTDVADHDGALVVPETEPRTDFVGDGAADDQPDAGTAPDGADTGGAAMEDQFAEDAEQNLRGAAAGGPSDGDHADAKDQGAAAHVAQTFDVFMPGADHFGFGDGSARRAEASAGQEQARDAPRGKQERERIGDEGDPEAELHDGGAAQKRAEGERGPLRGLGQRIGGVQFLPGGNGGQDG